MGAQESHPSRDRSDRKRSIPRIRNFTSQDHNQRTDRRIPSQNDTLQPINRDRNGEPPTSILRVVVKDETRTETVVDVGSTSVLSSTYKNDLMEHPPIFPTSPVFNYKQTEGQIRRNQIVDHEFECTEICPYLYVGGAKVAQSWNILEEVGITHIVNCAASVIPNSFEGKPGMCYLSLKMLDSRDDDVSWFICEVAQFIYYSMLQGKKMLLHCEKGISRSCSLAIAYHMWSTSSTWKQSFNYVKSRRIVSNPNTAFTCNLIEIDELISGDGKLLNVIFRCARHLPSDNTPILKLCRHQDTRQILSPTTSILDPRGVFVIRSSQKSTSLIFIWKGKYATLEMVTVASNLVKKMLGVFAKSDSIISIVDEGQESPEFFEYITIDEPFIEGKHRTYADLWGTEIRTPQLSQVILPSLRSHESESKTISRQTPLTALPPRSKSTSSQRLPYLTPIGSSSIKGTLQTTPSLSSDHSMIMMDLKGSNSNSHSNSTESIPLTDLKTNSGESYSTKEDSISIVERSREDTVLERDSISSRGLFDTSSARDELIENHEGIFAPVLPEQKSSARLGSGGVGTGIAMQESTPRIIPPLSSRPSSARPRSPRRFIVDSSSPNTSESARMAQSPYRTAVMLPSLESNTSNMKNEDSDVDSELAQAIFLSQRPEMTSVHLNTTDDGDIIISDRDMEPVSLPVEDSTGVSDMLIANSTDRSQYETPRDMLLSPRKLRKPTLYEAFWNSSRDVYEWQALGVYDDDDLAENTALLLVCPQAPHYLWIGHRFQVLSISEDDVDYKTFNLLFTQWACNIVDMTQLQRDKRVSYLLPLSRLEVILERDGYESESFWNAYASGY